MENIIEDTTEKLSNKIITKNKADKTLLDLFNVIQQSEQICSKCGGIKVCEWCIKRN